MPVYASELVSLMHALLERSLERCRAVYTEVKPCSSPACLSHILLA